MSLPNAALLRTSGSSENVTVECRTGIELTLILVATGLIAAAILQAPPLQSANDRSRWATVWSLVERNTFQIDEIDAFPRWSTIDKVRYRKTDSEPWHFYSTKPPLLSVLVAGLYAVERATLGYGLFNHTELVTRLLLLIVNGLPFLLALLSLRKCLLVLGWNLPVRLFVLITAGFGCILNPYLTTLNNHTPAAACAMFSICAMVQILRHHTVPDTASDKSNIAQMKTADIARLGFFSALTFCFELPAAQFTLIALIIAWWCSPRGTLVAFLPAAAVPVAAFLTTNWMVTGDLAPLYAGYGSETYVYEHRGIPSYWSNPRDLDANTESTLRYLFHCTLGHHGLLSLSPVLLLTVFGWIQNLRNVADRGRTSAFRPEHVLPVLIGALMTFVTLGYYLTRTQNYNYGGNSAGLRWMLWLTPFWLIAIPSVMPGIMKQRRVMILCSLLLAFSAGTVNWSITRPWKPSWIYERLEAAGWIRYRTSPDPFAELRTSVYSRIPQKAGITGVWTNAENQRLILTTLNTDGSLPDSGTETVSGQTASDQTTTEPVHSPASTRVTLRLELETDGRRITLLDESAVPPSPVASASNTAATDDPSRRHAAHAALRQIFAVQHWARESVSETDRKIPRNSIQSPVLIRPHDQKWSGFRPAGPSWVPSRNNPDTALKIHRGAARILVSHPRYGRVWYRCDVQYCDELPFGVFQWKNTVLSDATGEVLSCQTWTTEDY